MYQHSWRHSTLRYFGTFLTALVSNFQQVKSAYVQINFNIYVNVADGMKWLNMFEKKLVFVLLIAHFMNLRDRLVHTLILRLYFIQASLPKDPLAFVCIPRSQIRSFMQHNMSDIMVRSNSLCVSIGTFEPSNVNFYCFGLRFWRL